MGFYIIFVLLLVLVMGVLFRNHFLKIKRKELLEEPFSSEWIKILEDNVRIYNHLPDQLKEQLHQKVKIFVNVKVFEGCAGLKINDEIKVTIAAQACLLLLNRETKIFPECTSILVYPSAYVSSVDKREGHIVTNEDVARLGESWLKGPVVLSWDDVLKGAKSLDDADNVVIHEFTHQLDQEDGQTEGFPRLSEQTHYVTWARRLGDGYKKLQEQVSKGEETLLGEYAATHPAEYFAVLTEYFYEQPKVLKAKLPLLYRELKRYYKVNPVEWYNT